MEFHRINNLLNQIKPHTTMNRKETIKYALIGIAAIALCALLLLLPIPYHLLGDLGYIGVFLISLIASAGMLLPVPSAAATMVAATYLNPVLVGVAFGLGSTLGEISGYGIGYGGRAILDGNPIYERVSRWTQRYGMLAVFMLAVVPNPAFDAGGIACGALRMPIWKFMLATGCGRIIRGILIAFFAFLFPALIQRSA